MKPSQSISVLFASLFASLLFVACNPAPESVGQGSEAAVPANPESQWSSVGRSGSEQRFSPLTDIDTETVQRLGLTWSYEFDTSRGQEATPVVVDGVLYTSTAWSKVYAFNAASGELLWSHDPGVEGSVGFVACCDVVNRGVAVADGRVYVGVLDGRLLALDAQNGEVVWSTVTTDQSLPYTITGAPRVVKGNVLIGNGGAEYGVRGYLSAYDAVTGELAWRFYTTPNPTGAADGAASDAAMAQFAAATWYDGAWKHSGGGGTVWDAMAHDSELDLLYFGVGNGAPWDHTLRSGGKGDNLFLSSIVAVRPDDGEYAWHYQTTPGDTWDYTATQHIVLADMEVNGQSRQVLMQAPKNGFFYLIDRTDGSLISANNYVAVNWASGIGEDGRPVELPDARYDRSGSMSIVFPSPFGGHNWHPMSWDAANGLVYIPAIEMAFPYGPDQGFAYRDGAINLGIEHDFLPLPDDAAFLAATRAATIGKLIAWDPVRQEARWTVEHPHFWNAGVMATAGGLVFQGNAQGQFVAYSATDGEELWRYSAQNGIIAAPSSYVVDGRQYVAVMVGYGGAGALVAGWDLPDRPMLPGRLLVFSLDAAASIEPYDIPAKTPLDLTNVASSGDAGRGAALYNDNCLICHGGNASGVYLPDLRYSAHLLSEAAFGDVVRNGALSAKGMVGFAPYLSVAEVEAIRAYVLQRARMLSVSQ